MLASELHEVDSIAADADSELWILLRMIHRVDEELAVENVHIEVVATVWREVAVHEVNEVCNLSFILLAECGW